MTDVLILGGGPAGSGAAALLARLGHAVTLVTRPSRHTLGESVPPSSGKLLAELGLREAMDRAGFYRSRGNTVWWGSAQGRVEPFPEGMTGWQVERPGLDRVLVDAARAAGAEVEDQVAVRDVSLEDGSPMVTCDAPAGPVRYRAPWVLDCTGRAGILARRLTRIAEPDQRTFAVYGVWERPQWEVPDETHTLVESYEAGWAWSVPVSATRRYVAVMVDAEAAREAGPGLEAVYLRELGQTRHLAGALAGATRWGEVRGLSAAPYRAREVAGRGWLLVGDAASFIDPLSSFGIKKALASAWLAGVVVHTALTDPALADMALDLFRVREQDAYALLSRQAADMFAEAARVHRHEFWTARAAADPPPVHEPDVMALRTDPAVLQAFEALRQAPSIALRPGPDVRLAPRPTVRGTRVVLDDHVVSDWTPAGLRHLRGVNLPSLIRLAADTSQVGDLYQRYAAAEGPVALPDFLGVLSVLLARRVLVNHSGV